MKKALTQLDQKSLISWLQDQEEKPFHAKQIFYWLYQKNILSIEQMTNLSKPLRERLTKEFNCHSLILHSTKDSEDGQTTKYLFLLPDNNFVESVLIRAPDRVTLCVSSQVGCPARCAFCASGKKGLVRNLKFFEILEQVLFVQNHIGKKLSNIVFMGMGEPLENYENVIPAIKMLCDPSTFAFSPRRITLSTVGIIEGIEKLLQEDIKISLVLSLHAPTKKYVRD